MKSFINSAIFSFLFLVITGMLAFYLTMPVISDICFYIHLIPFGIGFTGGSNWEMARYYFIVWIVLTILFGSIAYLYKLKKLK